VARPHHKHSIRAAQVTAIDGRISTDDDVLKGHWTHPTPPLGSRKQVGISHQVQVGLLSAAAQLDEMVELGHRRPDMRIRSVLSQSFRHNLAPVTVRR
jgi:hypothetical protein